MTIDELEKRIIRIENHLGLQPEPAPAPERESITWSPFIMSNLYSLYDGTGGNTKYGRRWYFGTTNEDINFSGGGMNDFPLTHPICGMAFEKKPHGNYQVGMFMNKIDAPYFQNKFSFLGFTDNYEANGIVKTDLSKDIQLELELGLFGADFKEGSRGRVMIGAMARWNGRPHYVALNLLSHRFDFVFFNDENFDAVVVDRKWDCHQSQGVYYNYFHDVADIGVGVNERLSLISGEPLKSIRVPISEMFFVNSWSDMPSSWKGIKLAGTWVGMEIFGPGKLWIIFRKWNATQEKKDG